MSQPVIDPSKLYTPEETQIDEVCEADAEGITKRASKQTYYTIRFLVDRDRVQDAYRAYAYFRWVDDRIDKELSAQSDCIAFIERQTAIANGDSLLHDLTAEERMLVNLMHDGGPQVYIQNMLSVMAFDASRKNRLISAQELEIYTLHLATAVTEAMHYFIGHDSYSPQDGTRYLAVTAAHITHMLRDTFEDVPTGYFNISREFTEFHEIGVGEVDSMAYQLWVKRRVTLARAYFNIGRGYLARVENPRCRLAGLAYIARFEYVLDIIERENYHIRSAYPERKSLMAGLKMGMSVLCDMLHLPVNHLHSSRQKI